MLLEFILVTLFTWTLALPTFTYGISARKIGRINMKPALFIFNPVYTIGARRSFHSLKAI